MFVFYGLCDGVRIPTENPDTMAKSNGKTHFLGISYVVLHCPCKKNGYPRHRDIPIYVKKEIIVLDNPKFVRDSNEYSQNCQLYLRTT